MDSLASIIGLCVVIPLIVLAIYVLKKTTKSTYFGNDEMSIVSQLTIGTRERLLLVRVRSEWILIGATSQQISPLHVFTSNREED